MPCFENRTSSWICWSITDEMKGSAMVDFFDWTSNRNIGDRFLWHSPQFPEDSDAKMSAPNVPDVFLDVFRISPPGIRIRRQETLLRSRTSDGSTTIDEVYQCHHRASPSHRQEPLNRNEILGPDYELSFALKSTSACTRSSSGSLAFPRRLEQSPSLC